MRDSVAALDATKTYLNVNILFIDDIVTKSLSPSLQRGSGVIQRPGEGKGCTMLKATMFGMLALSVATPALAVTPAFFTDFEAAGVQNTTKVVRGKHVVSFDDVSGTGTGKNFVSSGTNFTATYSNVEILAAGNNGGAGGTGKYMRVGGGLTRSVAISNTSSQPTTYFGMWISAFDLGNKVEFFRGTTKLFSFEPAQMFAGVGSCPNAANAYCGNPNPGPFFKAVSSEPYVFVNFISRVGSFDRVDIKQASPVNPNAGYQTDNHTFATATGVPEPESWAMLIAGFGMVGFAGRRRNSAVAA